jgi:hypothetical protein
VKRLRVDWHALEAALAADFGALAASVRITLIWKAVTFYSQLAEVKAAALEHFAWR